MFEVFSRVADAILPVAAVVGAGIGAIAATYAVIMILSAPFGGPEIFEREPQARWLSMLAAAFAAFLAVRVVLLNL